MEGDGLDRRDLRPAIWRLLSKEIGAHLRQDGLPEPTDLEAGGLPSTLTPPCVREREAVLANAPLVSIVVATHDRPESLATCLDSLLSLDYPNFEIIVVDNAPSSSATADLIGMTYGDERTVRYVRERSARPWLGAQSRAAGSRGAKSLPLPTTTWWWIGIGWPKLVTGFTVAEHVGCVTGIDLSPGTANASPDVD